MLPYHTTSYVGHCTRPKLLYVQKREIHDCCSRSKLLYPGHNSLPWDFFAFLGRIDRRTELKGLLVDPLDRLIPVVSRSSARLHYISPSFGRVRGRLTHIIHGKIIQPFYRSEGRVEEKIDGESVHGCKGSVFRRLLRSPDGRSGLHLHYRFSKGLYSVSSSCRSRKNKTNRMSTLAMGYNTPNRLLRRN